MNDSIANTVSKEPTTTLNLKVGSPRKKLYEYTTFTLTGFPSCCGATVLHGFPAVSYLGDSAKMDYLSKFEKDLDQLYSSGMYQRSEFDRYVKITNLTVAILNPDQFYLEPALVKRGFQLVQEYTNSNTNNLLRVFHKLI